ncbi:uncharacterized protein LOC119457969 [Dermacentor silvarum]|uniref:uncharacterized protein LOC119457969 n=1 Tax=Dermacentor silvarum TaxID=543639 RepID=UPI002101202E|nr:uncharacterized protein LOC119457969 [Dermacentor silvarum]
MASRPPVFDETVSSWSTYRIRLEAYFEGNGITDAAKRRALLVSLLSDNVVRMLQGRLPTVSVNSQTYDEVVEYLEEHYNPQVNEIAASFSFFMRKQRDGESVREYIADLRRLAESCNFGNSLHRMLRDRIVCGIRDDDARRCLLTRKKLTFEEAEEFAIASEKALGDVRDMREADPVTTGTSINVVQSQRGRRPWTKWNTAKNNHSCERCGGPHATHTCRHRNTKCHHCGRKGHLAKVCSSGRSRERDAFAVEEMEGESEEEMLLALVAHSSADRATLKPLEEELTWQGRKLRMILDTGSPVSVIPKNIFKKHRRRWPSLQKTSLRLTCLLGPLPVVGQITMRVQSRSTVVTSTLIVVACNGPLLCGRNTIESFRKAGVSFWDTGTTSSVNVVRDNKMAPLLDEFSDLFENKLGCCKGPPVQLHLKEGVRPRFCKARTVPYAMRSKVSAQIDRLVQDGVLSSISISDWATPVVPVAKKNGDIRLCGDFKLTVNPASHLEQYPMPKVEDIFAALSGGEVFRTLDLRNTYNQLPLDDEARKIAVLNTHLGLYCYNRIAFGIASAPALFQRRMESILQGLPIVQVYLDDIIVAEKENDTSVLRQVFQRLREHNLKLNKAKCRFREAQVSFLGHRIDAKGLHPLQDNLEAVLAAPKPTSQLADSTSEDMLLRQVKTWILRGWPNQLGPEQQCLQPYFTRRSTPTRDGKSPAEMLLGFQPRTRLSAHFPEEEVARDPTVSRPPAPLSQVFSPGAPVWSRQYNHAGQRWLPGTVTLTRGRRMVTVDTTGGVQRRHVDQVRPRLAADDVKQEFDATRPGDNQVTESDQPSAVDDAEPSSDGSLGTPQTSSEVTSSVPAGLGLPRRSTRTRRPPDRLGF